jgi:hypothetical protein
MLLLIVLFILLNYNLVPYLTKLLFILLIIRVVLTIQVNLVMLKQFSYNLILNSS